MYLPEFAIDFTASVMCCRHPNVIYSETILYKYYQYMKQKGNSAYVYGRFNHDDELSHCLGI